MDQISKTALRIVKVFKSELRQIRTRLFRLNKSLQQQTKDITKTYQDGNARKTPPPEIIVNFPERIETHKEESEKTAGKKYQDRTLFAQWATLIAIIVYAVITAFIYRANKEAADAAKSAADTASRQLELTARPWVDINVSITSPLIYDSNGMHIGFTFIPNNIGQSPAQNVSIVPRLIPALMGDDLREKQRRICQNSAAQDQDADLKYVLFPGHNYSQEIGLGISNEEIDSRWSKSQLSRGPIDLIPITLVGCVDYTYESSPRHHQTGFAIDVLMKDGRIVLKSLTPLGRVNTIARPRRLKRS